MNKYIWVLLVFVLPVVIFAATGLTGVFSTISSLLILVKNLIFALAFIAFFYGLLTWIFASGDKKAEGKTTMIWGIIALFIMFSIWGIISILQSTFSGTRGGPIPIPGLPGQTVSTSGSGGGSGSGSGSGSGGGFSVKDCDKCLAEKNGDVKACASVCGG